MPYFTTLSGHLATLRDGLLASGYHRHWMGTVEAVDLPFHRFEEKVDPIWGHYKKIGRQHLNIVGVIAPTPQRGFPHLHWLTDTVPRKPDLMADLFSDAGLSVYTTSHGARLNITERHAIVRRRAHSPHPELGACDLMDYTLLHLDREYEAYEKPRLYMAPGTVAKELRDSASAALNECEDSLGSSSGAANIGK
jgi:hypothetical protein